MFYKSLALAMAAAGLQACGYIQVPRIPGLTPYRMEIQQGNHLSQEAVSQLKAGMTREQVKFSLGTPLLTDIFHSNRWDYVYFHEDAQGKRQQRKLAVFFEDDKLTRVAGDVVPAAGEGK